MLQPDPQSARHRKPRPWWVRAAATTFWTASTLVLLFLVVVPVYWIVSASAGW